MRNSQSKPGVFVEMVGPDSQMDRFGSAERPANPWPVKCPYCTLPDLDFVARPYLLAKGFAMPAETTHAEVGNFIVRERARKILELAVPGACSFHSTAEMKSKKPTPWSLAVPKLLANVPWIEAKKPSCPKCGQPKGGFHYTDAFWKHVGDLSLGKADVVKSSNWWSPYVVEDEFVTMNESRKKSGSEPLPWSHFNLEPPPHPQRWTPRQISRHVYFSIRLEQLFKAAKVKGQLVRSYSFKDVKPSAEDQAWVGEKLALLAQHGLAEASKSSPKAGAGAASWFKKYLSRNATKKPVKVDFAAVEKKQKIVLPQDYKDFIATVGRKSFEDVNQTEGFTANILPPTKLDFKDYRRGKLEEYGDDVTEVDGVMFADTDHGDCFVFDVSKKKGEFPVYWLDHEQNTLEPYAPGFAECIKRFAQRE